MPTTQLNNDFVYCVLTVYCLVYCFKYYEEWIKQAKLLDVLVSSAWHRQLACPAAQAVFGDIQNLR